MEEEEGRPFKLVVLCYLICSQVATSGSHVEYLPGFEGPLPFHIETGYVGVAEWETQQQKKEEDKLWLTGGPGCSSFSGLIFEIGPIAVKVEKYNGSLPNLVLRPQAWTKVKYIQYNFQV
ncbi:hypothetical protein K1719_016861 [Acacia pycnantha]|nr:hypothetical protein K1719_016861 [Acacia pycnantha]